MTECISDIKPHSPHLTPSPPWTISTDDMSYLPDIKILICITTAKAFFENVGQTQKMNCHSMEACPIVVLDAMQSTGYFFQAFNFEYLMEECNRKKHLTQGSLVKVSMEDHEI